MPGQGAVHVIPALPDQSAPPSFVGSWRIVETEVWSQDALDTVQPAYIRFDEESQGHLGLIVIGAGIDCRFSTRDGRPFVEFSFSGDDDGRPCSGRAWASIDDDGVLRGRLFLHCGDDSEFVAERGGDGALGPAPMTGPVPRGRRRRRR